MESANTACVIDHRGIDECLELMALPAGPERRRCRAALAAPLAGDARATVRAWFATALGDETVTLAAARAAFLLAGGAGRWAGQLLAAAPAEHFIAALRAHLPVPVPPELPAPMPCRPLSSWARAGRFVGEPLAGAEGGEP